MDECGKIRRKNRCPDNFVTPCSSFAQVVGNVTHCIVYCAMYKLQLSLFAFETSEPGPEVVKISIFSSRSLGHRKSSFLTGTVIPQNWTTERASRPNRRKLNVSMTLTKIRRTFRLEMSLFRQWSWIWKRSYPRLWHQKSRRTGIQDCRLRMKVRLGFW